MRGTNHTIDVELDVAPTFVDGAAGGGVGAALGRQMRQDLQSVTVTSSLTRPEASFTLSVVPRDIVGGATWADLLRPYAQVGIAVHRRGPSGESGTTPMPVPLCLGLVDPGGITMSEDYSQQAPRRTIQIAGRSLASVLVDQPWWYHHYLADKPPPELADYFEHSPDPVLLKQESLLQVRNYFAINEKLFEDIKALTPVAAMQAVYTFFVGTDGDGFVTLHFSDGRILKDRLRFDAAAAEAAFFDPKARFQIQFTPGQLPEASCWDAMGHFAEPPFMEMFTDTVGATLADAAVVVTIRKPPWAGHIVYPEKGASVGFSTGAQPGFGASLFDPAFGAWDRHAQTVVIDGNDVIGTPAIVRGSGPVYNTYNIQPQLGGASGANVGDQVLDAETPPIIDDDPGSPSYIRRYGVRLHPSRSTKYIPLTLVDGAIRKPAGGWARTTTAYAALLRSWHMWNPEMLSGTYTLRGNTNVRIGKRLYDADRGREFYITGVTHQVTGFDTKPVFTTSARVERGWETRAL